MERVTKDKELGPQQKTAVSTTNILAGSLPDADFENMLRQMDDSSLICACHAVKDEIETRRDRIAAHIEAESSAHGPSMFGELMKSHVERVQGELMPKLRMLETEAKRRNLSIPPS